MKFAFLSLGPGFDSSVDRVQIGGVQSITGVSSIEDACAVARALVAEGVGCIELCGAFGESGAQAVIEATGGKIPVGYVTHLPEQNEIYREVFGEE